MKKKNSEEIDDELRSKHDLLKLKIMQERYVALPQKDAEQSDYLKERTARGSKEKFLDALSKVPHVEPNENDKFD